MVEDMKLEAMPVFDSYFQCLKRATFINQEFYSCRCCSLNAHLTLSVECQDFLQQGGETMKDMMQQILAR